MKCHELETVRAALTGFPVPAHGGFCEPLHLSYRNSLPPSGLNMSENGNYLMSKAPTTLPCYYHVWTNPIPLWLPRIWIKLAGH
jgi:hypothetical protein